MIILSAAALAGLVALTVALGHIVKLAADLSLATPVIVKYRDSRTDTRTELEAWIR